MEVKLILSNFKSISLTEALEKNCTNQAFCKLQGNVPPENLSKSNNSSNNDKAIISTLQWLSKGSGQKDTHGQLFKILLKY